MKIKIICKNCGKAENKEYIMAMQRAGFGLRHLACRSCGQHTLTDNKEANDDKNNSINRIRH